MSFNPNGTSRAIKVSPTLLGGGAYTSGDAVGGILTLPIAVRNRGDAGVLLSVTVSDVNKQDQAIDVIFFDSNPVNTTPTDNVALAIAATDLAKVLGKISIAATDYADFSATSVATADGRGLVLKCNEDSSNLYACLVTRGTPTYAAAALQLTVGILQD